MDTFRKKINVSGYVQYPVGHGSELKFEFETDLTYVEKFLSGLKKILKEFPIKD
ncbi:WapI family immunity protein [Paenisporosarcina sp. TG-14]|uniref:WapI family immunity protein n=1 Tax=Paenisporosarcina sp. TG-14 TaxID=1231057 RepID=UPI003FCD5732